MQISNEYYNVFSSIKKVDFDAVVDALAITHIMRSKAGPATTRIKRLLELLSPYSFNLYYIKGKDMVLSDFLSRQKIDDSNPHELIPISFTLRNQIDNCFYRINSENDKPKTDKYLVHTRSQTKSSSIKILEIHGANKGLDPYVQPGKQCPLPSLPIHSIDKGPPTHPIPKPRIGQGRTRLKRKARTNQPMPLPQKTLGQPVITQVPKTALPLTESITQSQVNTLPEHIPIPLDNDSDRKVDIEENSLFQQGIISEIYERPDTSYMQETQELKDLIDTTKLIQNFLPNQTDIDKILDIIKRKVLKGTHLPLTIKEIQEGYLSSPYFKDLYLFLSQNKLPCKRSLVKKVKTLAESFVLLDSLIFKLVMTPDKNSSISNP